MHGTLKISVFVFFTSLQERVNSRQVSLYTTRCLAEESRSLAKEWVDMNGERFNIDYLDIVFSPDAIDINIDELK